jgi:hypothetical protein
MRSAIRIITVALLLFMYFEPAPKPAAAPAQDFRSVHGRNGFWRIVEAPDQTWWFQSPQGQLEFLNTVTTVQPYQHAGNPEKSGFESSDWHGDLDSWATAAVKRIGTTYGFKGIGAWSSDALIGHGMPVSRCLNLLDCLPQDPDARLFYSPGWEAGLEQAVREQVLPLKDKTDLLGYFTDNERDWSDGAEGPGRYFDHRGVCDANRLEVVKAIQEQWRSPADFSRDWHVELKSWSELSTWQELPRQPQEAYAQLLDAWMFHIAVRYFSVTTSLIHRYDPNHLILGARFRGHPPMAIVRAQRGFTDAVSINIYNGDGSVDLPRFMQMTRAAEQPIIVSEFSFQSLENRSADRNTCGFTALVPSQKARADLYVLFTKHLAKLPFVIGADWFQFNDEPPSGRGDGEDVNFGVVDIFDHPYELLIAAVRDVTPQLNPLHQSSAAQFNANSAQQ